MSLSARDKHRCQCDKRDYCRCVQYAGDQQPHGAMHNLGTACRKGTDLIVSRGSGWPCDRSHCIHPVSISDGTQKRYGIGPVSVLPEYQHRGIGKALIRDGLSRLNVWILPFFASGSCPFGYKRNMELLPI
jgi:GNAT superfamily N-acetyltransferase